MSDESVALERIARSLETLVLLNWEMYGLMLERAEGAEIVGIDDVISNNLAGLLGEVIKGDWLIDEDKP